MLSNHSVPRAAYIHVPFCAHRCGYCNFTLVAGRDDLIDAYLEAIELELAALETARPVETLFIGGGTPTHLPPAKLRRLIETVLRWHPLAEDREFSVEANPADLDDERVAVLAEYGVTRVSLGAQSFDAAKLALLERDHRAETIAASFAKARGRIPSVSVDLIFATPGETLDTWAADLEQLLTLGPNHVSTYGLTIERGTSFGSRHQRGELAETDDETWRAMYALAIDRLTGSGFTHYEVSNFARPGHRCRHNEAYWLGESYYAAGPGAARYVAGRREMNHRSTTTYLKRVLAGQSPLAETEALEPEDAAREMLVFGLRRLAGIERRSFAARTGFNVDQLAGDAVRDYVRLGLLEDDGRRLKLTRQGLFVSDSLWPRFLRV